MKKRILSIITTLALCLSLLPTAALATAEGGATAYTVTVADGITNGTVTADKTSAVADETVTLTLTPNKGYELDRLIVTDVSGGSVAVNSDNTFTMPAGNVTVTAQWKPIKFGIVLRASAEKDAETKYVYGTYGDTINLSNYQFSYEGHTLKGWSSKGDGTGKFNFAADATITAEEVAAILEYAQKEEDGYYYFAYLTAQWEGVEAQQNGFYIVLRDSAESDAETKYVWAELGESLDMSKYKSVFSSDEYILSGWSSKGDGTGLVNCDADGTIPAEDIKTLFGYAYKETQGYYCFAYLTAQWDAVRVGGVPVTESNKNDVLSDGKVSYDPATKTLTLNGASITDGYKYQGGCFAGVYAAGDLTIDLIGSSTVTVPEVAGVTESFGIWTLGDLTLCGEGDLTAQSGSVKNNNGGSYWSLGIYTEGQLTVSGATVTAKGGSVGLIDEEYFGYSGFYPVSAGVWTAGGLDVDFGGSLTAKGASAQGAEAISCGIMGNASGSDYHNLAVYDGIVTAEGGDAAGSARAYSAGIYTERCGLYVYESGAQVTAKAGSTGDNGASYSVGVLAFYGGVGIRAGTVDVTGKDYGIYVTAQTYSDGSSSGGFVDIECDEVVLNSYGYGFSGTKVSIKTEDGCAVFAQNGIDIDDTLTISAPEGGEAAGQGTMDEWYNWDYYIIVDSDGNDASNVEIEPLLYHVSFEIEGSSSSRGADVPVGMSLNEAYASTLEKQGKTDFSELLPTAKDGYVFTGFYTDSGDRFDFDTEITADVTLTARWSAIYYPPTTSTTTTKNEDGSTTTTTINHFTGTVTETTGNTDGTTGTVVTDKDGNVTEISAKVPASAVEESGEIITLPVEVEAANTTDDAMEIDVDVPDGGAKVEIPVTNITSGTVAVIVNADGTEKIVKTSTVTERGIVVSLSEDAAIKIVNNSQRFADVHSMDHWAESAIDFVSARDLMSGYGNGYFGPNDNLSRGMLAQILYNLEGCPTVSGEMNFTDVSEDMYYFDAIQWAETNGIVDGYGNGLFGPDDDVTRQQLAAMLYSYEQYKGGGFTGAWMFLLDYTDRDQISDWAYESMCWMTMHGVMSGYGNNVLGPRDNAPRAQVAQMLKNYLEKAAR